MHRLHQRLVASTPHRTVTAEDGKRTEQLPLQAVSVESFRDFVAECLYEVPSLLTHAEESEAWETAEREWNAKYERFWNEGFGEWSDEEIQQAYAS